MMSDPQNTRALCDRERLLTFHHLIPEKVQKKSVLLRQFSKEQMLTTGCW